MGLKKKLSLFPALLACKAREKGIPLGREPPCIGTYSRE